MCSDVLHQLTQALLIPLARLEPTQLHAERMQLHLLALDNPEQQLNSQQIALLWHKLPYWAFAWAGGSALAQWINQNPEAVRGKTVLDFGCGSAMVGIAAAKAGARQVWIADLDENAYLAAQLNAQLNQVELTPVAPNQWPEVEVLLASDVLYDISSSADLRQLMLTIPEWYLAESQFVKPDFVELSSLQSYITSTLPRIGDFDEQVAIEIFTRNVKTAPYI